jgi:thiol-disulfide isomerase/thioredoxin
MKKLILFTCFILFIFNASAQRVINNPSFFANNAQGLSISKVTISDTATLVSFKTEYQSDTWFRMPSGLYLVNGDQKLKIKWCDSLQLGKSSLIKGGKIIFTCNFPPISRQTKKIDLAEPDCQQQCFNIWDIELPEITAPQAIAGDWFKTDGSKQWELGFYNSKVAYNSRLWNYTSVTRQGKNVVIGLKDGDNNLTLTLKIGNQGHLFIVGKKSTTELFNSAAAGKTQVADTKSAFTPANVYKTGMAEYAGYIKGYSSRLGFKTGQIFVNNAVTGEQENYLVKIAEDGSFKVSFPVNYTKQCYVYFPFSYAAICFEAGKRVFQKFDVTGNAVTTSFMGDNAALNNDLYHTQFVLLNIDWIKVRKDLLNATPNQYKAYYINLREERLGMLNSYRLQNGMTTQAYNLARLGITYSLTQFLFKYNAETWEAYRQANNIAPENRRSQLPPVKLEKAYYSFFKDVKFNDPLAVVSADYTFFTVNLKSNEEVSAAQREYIFDYVARSKKNKNSEADAAFLDIMLADAKQDRIIQLKGDEQKNIRTNVLKGMIDADMSFDLQLMDAQDTTSKIEAGFTPLSPVQLAAMRSHFTNPYVFSLIKGYNTGIVNKIEANKKQSGYAKNETPEMPADSVFSSIINKYKGKTIYVDFWATWCGPCLNTIKEIAPLKEELKDNKNIVFVYITNQTSPIGTYNGMIPNIKGEHYRVSGDEWNKLTSQFQINGIPHYILVKNGVINNLKYQPFDYNTLKGRLLDTAGN